MAKVTYGDQGFVEGNPYPGTLDLEINDQRTKGVYTDDDSDATISFFGEKLKANLEDDNYFASGNIDKIVFKDGENTTLLTIKGDYKAAQLSAAFQEGGVEGLTLALFDGNDNILGGNGNDQLHGYDGKDRIEGGKGSDYIYGDAGNDILTGNKGVDYFVFNPIDDGKGKDVITDFDIKGEETDALLIEAEVTSYAKANNGADTLLTLGDGSTILLEHVKRADFVDYWESLS